MLRNNKIIFNIIIIALCVLSQGAFALNNSNWKLIIYMQADNDLYEYALKDIEELKISIKDSKKVEAYVFLDAPGRGGKKIMNISQYGSKDLVYIDENTSQVSDLELLLKISRNNKLRDLNNTVKGFSLNALVLKRLK